MSILLEALRKSEKNQHRREVPTIHSGEQADPAREPFRIGPLALLLIAALVVIGWLVWRQYKPATGYEPPVTLAAEDVQKSDTPTASPERVATAEPPATASQRPAPRNRTPVESFKPADAGTKQARSTDTGPGTRTAPEKPATKASRPRPASQRLANSRNAQAATNTPGDADAASAGTESHAAASKEPPARQKPKRDSRETQPISYWELPDAIRNSVPEIKFSVLVYAKNPADRFVLINGERLGEGDSAQPGLVVKEIRLDGVVFSYRLYQFLVEK
jgi:general secretion pathway protein B